MASRDERAWGWEPDVPAGGPAPPGAPAARAAALRDDLAALEQARETLEDEWAARDRRRPPPGAGELEDRTPGLADWERAHGRAELELRAIEAGWWDEWSGWTRAGLPPGQADAEAVG